MTDRILELFAEHLEKQDLLSKLTEQEILHGYSYSEIHFIDAVGVLDHPNVTKIASHLKITRGAVSRMAKKQIARQLIESYSSETNKKEIYFRLTSQGQELFVEHQNRHKLWKQRDTEFFNRYSTENLEQISDFLEDFNHYLKQQIESLSNEKR